MGELTDELHDYQDAVCKLREELDAAHAKIDRLHGMHKHCEHCGGSWLDDGINGRCNCLEIERLREQLAASVEAHVVCSREREAKADEIKRLRAELAAKAGRGVQEITDEFFQAADREEEPEPPRTSTP